MKGPHEFHTPQSSYSKEDLLKSPEQLESEKIETIKHRTPKLDLQGLNKEDLIATVRIHSLN